MSPKSNPEQALHDGSQWRELCRTLERAGERVLDSQAPGTPRDRAEGFRHLTRFLAAGIATCVEFDDPDTPEFGRMIEHSTKWGLDAPDCLYLYAAVRGDARYRIFGNRGTAHHLDVQVNFGHFAEGDISRWGTISSLSGFELECEADGSFEIRIGGEPQPHNWLALRDDAQFVLLRQYFGDWDKERPGDLFIERLAAPVSAPAPSAESMARRLARLTRWLDRGGALWEGMSRGLLSMEPNSLVVHRPEDAGERAGMADQAYGMGNFHCPEGEAVLLELTPPRCHHWSVSLANYWWESFDYVTHQSSLNGQQVRLDADGVFRAILAHDDPGVPNWLDTTGHERGSLALRFLLAESAPLVRMVRFPFMDVRRHVAPDTPHVSPRSRAARIASRRLAIWHRDRR